MCWAYQGVLEEALTPSTSTVRGRASKSLCFTKEHLWKERGFLRARLQLVSQSNEKLGPSGHLFLLLSHTWSHLLLWAGSRACLTPQRPGFGNLTSRKLFVFCGFPVWFPELVTAQSNKCWRKGGWRGADFPICTTGCFAGLVLKWNFQFTVKTIVPKSQRLTWYKLVKKKNRKIQFFSSVV